MINRFNQAMRASDSFSNGVGIEKQNGGQIQNQGARIVERGSIEPSPHRSKTTYQTVSPNDLQYDLLNASFFDEDKQMAESERIKQKFEKSKKKAEEFLTSMKKSTHDHLNESVISQAESYLSNESRCREKTKKNESSYHGQPTSKSLLSEFNETNSDKEPQPDPEQKTNGNQEDFELKDDDQGDEFFFDYFQSLEKLKQPNRTHLPNDQKSKKEFKPEPEEQNHEVSQLKDHTQGHETSLEYHTGLQQRDEPSIERPRQANPSSSSPRKEELNISFGGNNLLGAGRRMVASEDRNKKVSESDFGSLEEFVLQRRSAGQEELQKGGFGVRVDAETSQDIFEMSNHRKRNFTKKKTFSTAKNTRSEECLEGTEVKKEVNSPPTKPPEFSISSKSFKSPSNELRQKEEKLEANPLTPTTLDYPIKAITPNQSHKPIFKKSSPKSSIRDSKESRYSRKGGASDNKDFGSTLELDNTPISSIKKTPEASSPIQDSPLTEKLKLSQKEDKINPELEIVATRYRPEMIKDAEGSEYLDLPFSIKIRNRPKKGFRAITKGYTCVVVAMEKNLSNFAFTNMMALFANLGSIGQDNLDLKYGCLAEAMRMDDLLEIADPGFSGHHVYNENEKNAQNMPQGNNSQTPQKSFNLEELNLMRLKRKKLRSLKRFRTQMRKLATKKMITGLSRVDWATELADSSVGFSVLHEVLQGVKTLPDFRCNINFIFGVFGGLEFQGKFKDIQNMKKIKETLGGFNKFNIKVSCLRFFDKVENGRIVKFQNPPNLRAVISQTGGIESHNSEIDDNLFKKLMQLHLVQMYNFHLQLKVHQITESGHGETEEKSLDPPLLEVIELQGQLHTPKTLGTIQGNSKMKNSCYLIKKEALAYAFPQERIYKLRIKNPGMNVSNFGVRITSAYMATYYSKPYIVRPEQGIDFELLDPRVMPDVRSWPRLPVKTPCLNKLGYGKDLKLNTGKTKKGQEETAAIEEYFEVNSQGERLDTIEEENLTSKDGKGVEAYESQVFNSTNKKSDCSYFITPEQASGKQDRSGVSHLTYEEYSEMQLLTSTSKDQSH